MKPITAIVDGTYKAYDRLPLVMRQSALPFIIVSLPIVISSLLGAFIVMPLIVLLTAYQLYLLTLRTDEFMFSLSKFHARLGVTLPLCTFISVWAFAIALVSRKAMLNGVVGPYCVLLLVACAPAFRWKESRIARRLPAWVSFTTAGGIAFAASLFYAKT
jgi:hypothetical protein